MKVLKTLKPGDFLIVILILCFSVFVIIKNSGSQSGKVIVNTRETVYEYSLDNDGVYKIPGDIGDTVFEIKDKKVRIIDSPCPNKTCIAQGWTTPIICLPNNVVIHVVESETETRRNGGFDGISQ